jgi:hypothetical protein
MEIKEQEVMLLSGCLPITYICFKVDGSSIAAGG